MRFQASQPQHHYRADMTAMETEKDWVGEQVCSDGAKRVFLCPCGHTTNGWRSACGELVGEFGDVHLQAQAAPRSGSFFGG